MVKRATEIINGDAYKIAAKPLASIKKSMQGKWLGYFFKNINPFNWFNDLSNIEIKLDEFGGVKISQQGKILSAE